MAKNLIVDVHIKADDAADGSFFCEYTWKVGMPLEWFEKMEDGGLEGIRALRDAAKQARSAKGNA